MNDEGWEWVNNRESELALDFISEGQDDAFAEYCEERYQEHLEDKK